VGEELDDGEGLPRGPEEGVEAGGVEVHGGIPLRHGAAAVADAERAEGVRASRGGEDEEEEDGEGEEARRRRRRHGSRLDGSPQKVLGPDPAIPAKLWSGEPD
jgi:hypothetical protein